MPLKTNHLKPLARPLLLDSVPGAAAAYSLRQLSNAYTGPVVTVRRSSDDAEADFKASEIDDGTLTAFCGAGDGLVKTWFDQSGNGRDASQGTAGYQPKIVDSGSLVTEGGKAALLLDGAGDNFAVPATSYAGHVFFVGRSTTATYTFQALSKSLVITAGASAPFVWCVRKTGDGSVAADSTVDCSYQAVLSMQTTEDDVKLWVNGALEATDTVTNAFPETDDQMFRRDALGYFGGKVHEVIVYNTDVSSQRKRIEGDLAWYY